MGEAGGIGEAGGMGEAGGGEWGVRRGRVRSGAAGRRVAVERLRRAILGGDMAPGQRMVEEELAGMLAVTRASVPAALFALTADGLVERVPNRGWCSTTHCACGRRRTPPAAVRHRR